VALAALGAAQQNRVGKLALSVLLLGTLLFSGSLVAGAIWQVRTGLAPVGGSALMLGWVVYAFNALRR
jgi:uncharacterized membrane protein YgdD (TMEM256/DUF423 family)